MTDKELEARLKKIEGEVRQLKAGSNNPHIVLSLREAVVELRKNQQKIIKHLLKLRADVDKLKEVKKTGPDAVPQRKPTTPPILP